MLVFFDILGKLDYPPGLAGPWSLHNILSVEWWLQHLHDAWMANPGHFIAEGFSIAVIIYLLLRRPYNPKTEAPLTHEEEERLLLEWKETRDPLANQDLLKPRILPPSTLSESKGDAQPIDMHDTPFLVNSSAGRVIRDETGREFVNFASTNFLDIAGHDDLKKISIETIHKLGVGSCGPRGFYGTSEMHLMIEEKIAEHLGTQGCSVYSDGIACIASVIPSFAKSGDLIIADESCHYLIQQGIYLSRANVFYYRHNDAGDLGRVLQMVQEEDSRNGAPSTPTVRRFIVCEGVSFNHGDICPLKEILQLKNKFRYRLILDDTYGFCSIDSRGTPGFFGIAPSEVDVYVATLDTSLGSIGGICAGSTEITQHQTLSGVGYCFSASAPPFTARAAVESLEILHREPHRLRKLRENVEHARKIFSREHSIVLEGALAPMSKPSPVLHLRLPAGAVGSREEEYGVIERLAVDLRTLGFAVSQAEYLPRERKPPRPSLRVFITASLTKEDIDRFAGAVTQISQALLGKNET